MNDGGQNKSPKEILNLADLSQAVGEPTPAGIIPLDELQKLIRNIEKGRGDSLLPQERAKVVELVERSMFDMTCIMMAADGLIATDLTPEGIRFYEL